MFLGAHARERMASDTRESERSTLADCGHPSHRPAKDWGWITAHDNPRFAALFPERIEMPFSENKALEIPVDIRPTEQHVYGLKPTLPGDAK